MTKDKDVVNLDDYRNTHENREARLDVTVQLGEIQRYTAFEAAKRIADELQQLKADLSPHVVTVTICLLRFKTPAPTERRQFMRDIEAELAQLFVRDARVHIHPQGSVIVTTIPIPR